ncbi:PDDEXK-like family protein [Pontibacter lucknowensis]|uniref:PD-(D/E)XK nuclease superfamily protein n=1 Tax=Pontibacter lucknowensis TaxID=1077936 RepID=A0A1N6XB04_9BACT|nr:PD-(D/E)XK nuclease family protein [Pontibacter lucknowensis]SIQ99503.1 PD-(D/E)XK nuclease superfamily protein [Pontibacter lucknowensis]
MAELTELELQQEYLKLMENTSLDKLELALNEPNIFSILAIDNLEIRHSNFLAWLLNPKESHGLSDQFLKRFLREIFFNKKIKEVTPLDAEKLDYGKVTIKREWKHIDLLIAFPDLVICLENKVRAKDNGKQLTDYKNIIEKEYPESKYRQVFIYLTPYGSSSSHEQDKYAFISYRTIIKILDRILQVYKDLISPQASFYIQDYIKSLKRNLMGTDTTNKLAREIYLNHKKLLDFIFENRPDHMDEFAKLLWGFLKEKGFVQGSPAKGYIRFINKSLKGLIPLNEKRSGWSKKEAFLLEFEFIHEGKLIFKATASPTSANKKYRNKLSEILIGEGEARTRENHTWIVYFQEVFEMDVKGQMRENPYKLPDGFETFWTTKVEPIIDNVEKALLAHKIELIALNS